MRRPLITASIVTLVAIGIGSVFFALNRAANREISSRSGPVHRFPAADKDPVLTDEYAARIAREVMNRDGYPESPWRMIGNTTTANRGVVSFYCDKSATPVRYVNIELRNGKVTAQGTMGK
jgi:hypothetical protein